MKDSHTNAIGHFGLATRWVKTGKESKPEEIVSKESRYVGVLKIHFINFDGISLVDLASKQLESSRTWCVGLKLKESLWKWSWILALWTTALIPPESTVPITNIVSNPPMSIIVNTKSVHKTRVLPAKSKICLKFLFKFYLYSCLYLTSSWKDTKGKERKIQGASRFLSSVRWQQTGRHPEVNRKLSSKCKVYSQESF